MNPENERELLQIIGELDAWIIKHANSAPDIDIALRIREEAHTMRASVARLPDCPLAELARARADIVWKIAQRRLTTLPGPDSRKW